MSEPKAETFKHFMGTFLLRRNHYFSGAGHLFSSDAGSVRVEI